MPLRFRKVRMIRRGLTRGHANGKTVVTVADIPAIVDPRQWKEEPPSESGSQQTRRWHSNSRSHLRRYRCEAQE
jgi:hypothetical protein